MLCQIISTNVTKKKKIISTNNGVFLYMIYYFHNFLLA